VTGFAAGTDKVHFDESIMDGAGVSLASTTHDFVEIHDNNTAAAGAITTQTLTGNAVASDGVGMFLLDLGSTKFASAALAVDSFEALGAAQLTFSGNITADDAFLFAYENSTSGVNIAVASFQAADDNSNIAAAAASTKLETTDLMTLSGISDVTTLASDFVFIV
jgi:hypothetical protein